MPPIQTDIRRSPGNQSIRPAFPASLLAHPQQGGYAQNPVTPGVQNHLITRVQAIFLDSVEALAQSPDQLVAALQSGLDGVINQLLRQACDEVGLDIDVFAQALERDPVLHESLQARISALFNNETIHQARQASRRRDAERHLHIMRFALSGDEPAPWVWESMDDEEEARLRAFRSAGGDDDPALLERVRRALAKLDPKVQTYGECEDCHQAIPVERLQLIPYAERCTRCQRHLEGAAAHSPRVPFFMFFEGGQPVPADRRLVS